MEQEAIQEMLDGFDRQLASGKIDLQTYQALTVKWQGRLTEVRAEAARTRPPEVAPTRAALAVVCPECSAPLEDTAVAPGSVVRCAFCRATFTLQKAEETTERAGQELRRWLEQIVMEASAGGTVDAASRAFIFGEKLAPALQLEYRRAMEPYEDVQEHPLVSLSLLDSLVGYRPSDHVLVRRSDGLGKVRALSVKVHSPLVSAFALGSEDHAKLVDLNLGTTNLIYLANVAQLLNQPSPEAYTAAKENLVALGKQYADRLASGQEGESAQFLHALRARLAANARALDVLSTIFVPGADFVAQPYLEELDAAREQLQEAARAAEASGYNPLAVVPLRTGIERDERSLALLQAVLRAYRAVSRGRASGFSGFYSDLKKLLAALCPRVADPTEYASTAEQVTNVIRGQRGDDVLRLVGGWEWAEKQVSNGVRRGLFGGAEQVAGQTFYWHPFWYALLQYSVAKGTFFVSGVEQVGLGLLDGLASDAEAVVALNDSAIYSTLAQAIEAPRAGDGRPVLLPLSSAPAAERAIGRAARSIPDLRNVKVRVEGLVHVPAVSAQYQSKSGIRQTLYSYPLRASNAAVPLLADVSWFFEQYT